MKYLFVVFFLISSFVFAEQQYKTHRVSQGETVESIAKDYGVPVKAILKLNPDARKGISSSTTLIIPADAVAQAEGDSFKIHKVKSKETLYGISREYNISIEDIKRYNTYLYEEPLRKGDKLRIPPSHVEAPAQETTAPEAEARNSDATREHIVLPKETMYGIAREYGLEVNELEAMNPWVDTLQPGMMLTIELKPNPNTVDETNFRIYEVQPKETMYSLTREFGISRDSLIALNPALRDGLKAGMELKLPNKNDSSQKASYFSASEDLEARIENKDAKKLVLMLPFNLDKVEIDSVSLAKERIRKDQVLQISLDFYSGVLLAIDSAKSRGISVDLQVLDSRQNPAHIASVINNNDFNRVDAVIGPLLQGTAIAAARNLGQRGIPVVSPFSNKEVPDLENFVQTRPTQEMMEDVMIEYLQENANNRNIIIIAENSASAVKNKLSAAIPSAKIVVPSDGSVSKSELTNALDENRENWIVMETNSIGMLSSLTSRLNSMRDTYNISIFTTDRNKAFESDNVSNQHLSNLNFHYPSVDKEYDLLRNRDFISAYRDLYGMDPNQYAVRGFDITYDVILRLAVFNSIYDSFEHFDGTTEYAENKFHYQKMEDGGFYNNAVYIIRLDQNLKRNVVR